MAPTNHDLKPSDSAAREAKQDYGGNQSKTNLLINYLPQSLTDEQFRSIFTSIGPIKSSKIVRRKATGRSYGFGFVDYRDAGHAACAIESLNGLQVLDKTIKVSYARPGGENIKNAKLYIRGIPKDYPLEQAEKVFANFGKLIQFRVIEAKSRADRRLAFVIYDLRENAEAATRALTGTMLPGATMPLVIKNGQPPSKKRNESRGRRASRQLISTPSGATGGGCKRQFHGCNRRTPPYGSHYYIANTTPGTSVPGWHTLSIYNIGTDTDERSLWRFIANYGNVINVSIVHDTACGQPMGYGLVTMASFQDCVSVIEALNLVPIL